MKLLENGKNTLGIEVTNISAHGFWVLFKDREYFLSFEKYPWFKDAKISAILNVRLIGRTHIYWPELDVDLSVEILSHPEQYPLLYE